MPLQEPIPLITVDDYRKRLEWYSLSIDMAASILIRQRKECIREFTTWSECRAWLDGFLYAAGRNN